MVGQMDSKNSQVTFAIKIIFWRTFVIITSCCNVIRDNTKLEGQVRGIGQSSPASFLFKMIVLSNDGFLIFVQTMALQCLNDTRQIAVPWFEELNVSTCILSLCRVWCWSSDCGQPAAAAKVEPVSCSCSWISEHGPVIIGVDTGTPFYSKRTILTIKSILQGVQNYFFQI